MPEGSDAIHDAKPGDCGQGDTGHRAAPDSGLDVLATPAAGLATPPGRRRRTRRILLICLLVFLLLSGGSVTAAGLYLHSVTSSVSRVDAFTGVPPAARPTKVVPNAMNMLILGSDSRDPDNLGGSRSDTIILAHFPQGRNSVQLVSIPRDTWVRVPKSADGRYGNTNAKINAAYAWGGVPLIVQTVESYTGIRIDHVAIVDFAGFQQIVDALGGIDIDVDQSFTSIHPPYRKFVAGVTHMDGATALDYSRQRKQFADGDFARIRHQQQVITAILDAATTGGLLTDPLSLNSFLRAVANAVSVDKTFSIVDTAMDLRHLRSEDVTFFTSPSKGTGMAGDQSVVFPDTAKAKALFGAIQRDSVPDVLNETQ
jgi:LCP family protein required for cell wall assembly